VVVLFWPGQFCASLESTEHHHHLSVPSSSLTLTHPSQECPLSEWCLEAIYKKTPVSNF
jgi:hypothetical protein